MSTPLAVIFVGILGAAFGSFSSVILHRVPDGKSICGRSRCPNCQHVLQWFVLVPILSYIALRSKCHYCHAHISPRYFLLEIIMAAAFVAMFLSFKTSPVHHLVLLMCICTTLVLIGFHDYATSMIPDLFNGLFISVSLIYRLLQSHPAASLLDSISGAAIPVGLFGSLWLASRGRWIGSGDILFGAGMGILLGWQATILALFLAYTLGAIVCIALLAAGVLRRKSRVPFGPFLCIGTFLSLCYGPQLVEGYFALVL